jgi:hypothetical protein
MNSMMLMEVNCARMTLEELIATRKGYTDRQVGPHTLTGPIFVKGAEPGDVLEVRIKKLVPADCGVNYHFPGRMNIGGLPEDFPVGQFKTLKLDTKNMKTTFAPGVVIPLKPFFGVMGVAPKPGEKKPAAVPDYFGANMDNKELLPEPLCICRSMYPDIFLRCPCRSGAGVNVTAIETAMKKYPLIVRKDMKIRPMAETSHYAMGFHKELGRENFARCHRLYPEPKLDSR